MYGDNMSVIQNTQRNELTLKRSKNPYYFMLQIIGDNGRDTNSPCPDT